MKGARIGYDWNIEWKRMPEVPVGETRFCAVSRVSRRQVSICNLTDPEA